MTGRVIRENSNVRIFKEVDIDYSVVMPGYRYA